MTLTFGSLFAGIGGMDLGLERAGMRCAWQVEIDEYATRVLAKHWPGVERFRDVRECGAHNLAGVDLVCGGFPCQPVSKNGHQKAELDERWLWPHFSRIIRALRPRYVLLENVTGLLVGSFGGVLSDLASCGYDAEWEVLPASAFGAPQPRERVFVLAYPDSLRREAGQGIFPQDFGGRLLAEGWRGVFRRGASGRVRLCPDGEDYWLADGLPEELDALRGYGNAVVSQVAQWIGEQIIRFDEERQRVSAL